MSGTIQLQFQFFDYDIAILTALYYVILSFWQMADTKNEKSSLWINCKYTLMLNLILIFLVDLIVIQKGHLPEDADIRFMFSHFTIYILPFLVLLDWLLFDSKGNFNNKFILFACIPLWLYVIVVYTLKAIGNIEGFYDYPYFFMSLSEGNQSLHLSLLFTIHIAFIVLCYLIIQIDGLPAFFAGIASKIKKPKSEG